MHSALVDCWRRAAMNRPSLQATPGPASVFEHSRTCHADHLHLHLRRYNSMQRQLSLPLSIDSSAKAYVEVEISHLLRENAVSQQRRVRN
jgi:hypothetical protein